MRNDDGHKLHRYNCGSPEPLEETHLQTSSLARTIYGTGDLKALNYNWKGGRVGLNSKNPIFTFLF